MGTDFPPFNEVVKNVGGILLPLESSYLELETGVYRAIPSNEKTAQILVDCLSWSKDKYEEFRQNCINECHKNYNWDTSVKKFENLLDTLNPNELEKKWHAQADIKQPNLSLPQGTTNEEFVRFCIQQILCDESKLNTYYHIKWLRDINRKGRPIKAGGSYFIDESFVFDKARFEEYSRERLAQDCLQLRNEINHWESIRCQK
jgi:hypothetical protein